MYSVYGKRPKLEGEKGFPPSQTDQDYHTLNEILNKLVQEGKSLPAVEQPKEEDSLDDIDPTKQRGFDLADTSIILETAREALANDKGVKYIKADEKSKTSPILDKEKGNKEPDASEKDAPEAGE